MRITNPKLPRRTAAPGVPQTAWWLGRPLAEGKVAHHRNSQEAMDSAIASDCNWVEGDIRKSLDGKRLEMRHSSAAEGTALGFDAWLAAVKPAGRGLKLNCKEPQHMEEIIAAVKASEIPSDRLMWNLGDAAMATWAAKLRQKFPRSILALRPTLDGDKITTAQVARLISLAKRGGMPMMFLLPYDKLTDTTLRGLRPYGPISVSSAPVSEVAALRTRGVDGVIELAQAAVVGEASTPVERPEAVNDGTGEIPAVKVTRSA
ncbi:MAG TPA: hypothetical protein VGO62_12745 [Myxococcota bacterium]|jgi:hypothetical protein